jgi:tetratricopeptide (TPR) repeat protein
LSTDENFAGEAAAVSPARHAAEEARVQAQQLNWKGEFAKALELYDESLAQARETGDAAFIDFIYACRAAAAAEMGPARDELVELKRILLRTKDPQTAFRAAFTGARIYEFTRDFRKAAFYNGIARHHADATGDLLLIVSCESQLGNVLIADSRFEDAAHAYQKALDLSEPPAPITPIGRAIWKDNLGYCQIALDRTAEGLRLVHEALDVLEGEQAVAHTIYPLLDLCFGYLKANRLEESRYFGEAGLERLEHAAEPGVEKNFLYLLGEASQLSGDAAAAGEYFDRLASHYPEFRNLRAYLEVFDFRNVINLRG